MYVCADNDGLLLYDDVRNLLGDIATALASHDRHKQIRFAFHVFDRNRDGLLDRAELMTVLQSTQGKDFSKKIPKEELDTIVDAIFQSTGEGKDGLNFDEFRGLLLNKNGP
jgi:Ca2+-binding EF-hand superfamily protein